MRSTTFQNNFLKGEISDTLATRIDTKIYSQGLKRAKNVQLIPHGGAKRRNGTLKTGISFASKVRLEAFEFANSQSYLVTFALGEIKVYQSNTLISTINLNTYLTRNLTTTELSEMDVIQSADTMIVVHPNFAPFRIVRATSPSVSFSVSAVPLTNIPIFDFTSNTAGNIEYFKGDGTTTDFVLVYTVPFFSVYVNGSKVTAYTHDTGAGKVKFTSAPAAGADIQVISGSAMTAMNQDIPYEPVWSATRGYPKTATFHQGRLWFGGSTSKPTSIWGSVINEQFNFKLGDSADDMGIFDTIQSNDYNGIVSITSGRTLQVFTETAEFVNTAQIITPKDSAWVRQSAYGSKRIRPMILDGTTFFTDRSGKTIMQYIYDFNEDGFQSRPITLLSSHLFTGIVELASTVGSGDDVSSLLYVIDSSGKMNVLNTMRTEEISGWTQWETTNATFEDITVVANVPYVLVKRGSTYYVETLSDTTNMDFTHTGTGTRIAVTNGFNYDVVSDGYYMGVKTPYLDTGVYYVDIGRTSTTAQAGLGFEVEVKTLNLNTTTQAGFTLNKKKRPVKVTLDLYETLAVSVQGEVLGDRIFPIALDAPATPFTGQKEIYLLGWDRTVYLTVTQTKPLSFTLLGLETEISSS